MVSSIPHYLKKIYIPWKTSGDVYLLSLSGGEMKILVAIKSASVLDSLFTAIGEIDDIKSMGYVTGVEDAINLIKIVKFDLLIVEVQLRDGSGFNVLAHVRETAPFTKVIVVTDAPFVEYKSRALELGADFFFNMVQDFEIFLQVLKKMSLGNSGGQGQKTKILSITEQLF
jgi:DNA-binding NarL/FixJ family response regulator